MISHCCKWSVFGWQPPPRMNYLWEPNITLQDTCLIYIFTLRKQTRGKSSRLSQNLSFPRFARSWAHMPGTWRRDEIELCEIITFLGGILSLPVGNGNESLGSVLYPHAHTDMLTNSSLFGCWKGAFLAEKFFSVWGCQSINTWSIRVRDSSIHAELSEKSIPGVILKILLIKKSNKLRFSKENLFSSPIFGSYEPI